MSIVTLGVDLGTNTGVSIAVDGKVIAGTTLCLATDKELRKMRQKGLERAVDLRVVRLGECLNTFIFSSLTECSWVLPEHHEKCPTHLVFEDVQFHASTAQTQLWASLRGALMCFWVRYCSHPHRQFQEFNVIPVPVATLKKYATGRGDADKHDMMGAAHCGGDDNQADATHLALYGYDLLTGKIPKPQSLWEKRKAKAQRRKKKEK